MKFIDLRSDTVTRPSPDMLKAMMNAEVGDDVFGDDPTVIKLEKLIAERAQMEAAVFAPSGTQTNLMALMSHCERGDEYIVGQTAHTYAWEGGGAAVLGSIQPQPLDFEPDGTLSLEKINAAIKPVDDHHARTTFLCLENTTAGKVLPLVYLKQVSEFCKKQNLLYHLDGARVFNAVAALNISLHAITQYFDSISICLSKGLGAPVGSVLCGNKDFIRRARRWRKVLGGGMRQAGILAAAGIYALENNVSRLEHDHAHAKILASQLEKIDEIKLAPNTLHTNMFFIQAPNDYVELRNYLETKNIIFPKLPNKQNLVRLMTHLDISENDIEKIISEIKNFYAKG